MYASAPPPSAPLSAKLVSRFGPHRPHLHLPADSLDISEAPYRRDVTPTLVGHGAYPEFHVSDIPEDSTLYGNELSSAFPESVSSQSAPAPQDQVDPVGEPSVLQSAVSSTKKVVDSRLPSTNAPKEDSNHTLGTAATEIDTKSSRWSPLRIPSERSIKSAFDEDPDDEFDFPVFDRSTKSKKRLASSGILSFFSFGTSSREKPKPPSPRPKATQSVAKSPALVSPKEATTRVSNMSDFSNRIQNPGELSRHASTRSMPEPSTSQSSHRALDTTMMQTGSASVVSGASALSGLTHGAALESIATRPLSLSVTQLKPPLPPSANSPSRIRSPSLNSTKTGQTALSADAAQFRTKNLKRDKSGRSVKSESAALARRDSSVFSHDESRSHSHSKRKHHHRSRESQLRRSSSSKTSKTPSGLNWIW